MQLHSDWIQSLVSAGLARYEEATVTVRNVPNKGDEQKVPFQDVVFLMDTAEDFAKAVSIAEAGRGTVEVDGKQILDTHPLTKLIKYAYNLNCRQKVRSDFEGRSVDPEKGLKKIAEMFVKIGRYKSFEKALAAVRLSQEDDE